jgi:DNA polymerase III subunit epsilon
VSNDDLFELDQPLPEWAKKPIAVFDLETTGLDHRTSRIVTACAALLNPDGTVNGDDVEWLANPGIPIPAEATAVHGITDEIAQSQGEDLSKVVASIVATLRSYFERGIPVVAYNAPYDFTILRQHAEDFGIVWPENPSPILDPLVLDKKLVQFRKGKRRLEIVAGYYNVKLDDAHNATADAIAAGHVAQAMAAKFPVELDVPLAELHASQAVWSREQDESFAKFMRGINPDFQPTFGWPEKPRA